MIYVIISFFWGLLTPYIARRIAKTLPATLGYAIWQIFSFTKTSKKALSNTRYKKLRGQYIARSILSGILLSIITYIAYRSWGDYQFSWRLSFIFLVYLLAEVDRRTLLLPDILTVPLLILGFVLSVWGMGFISAQESGLGSVVGFVFPSLVSLLLAWKSRDALGGGDIKMFSAIGSWVGAELLLYVVFLSAIIGLIEAIIRRRRSGAYGPAISISAIIVAIYFF